jgi:hypothetical protein
MITQEQFESYEELRQSGVTNMYVLKTVMNYTGLEKEQIVEIMHNYKELKAKYYPEVKLDKVKNNNGYVKLINVFIQCIVH